MNSIIDRSNIHFFSEDVSFSIAKPNQYKKWVFKIASYHKTEIKALNYIFCSDSYLLQVNKEYLEHDYYTDIISFPYSEFPDPLEGDIFISIDRVKENALDNQIAFEDELLRVMAHGVLHFLGFQDKSEKESHLMRKKEEEMIELF